MSPRGDKFLDAFRPSAVLMLWAGCFPFSGIFGSELQFRLLSFPTLYSIAFLIHIVVVLEHSANLTLEILPHSFASVVILFQDVAGILNSIFVVAFFLVRGSRIAKILTEVDAFPRHRRKRVAEITIPLGIFCVVAILDAVAIAVVGFYFQSPSALCKGGFIVAFVALLLRIASFIRDIIQDLKQPQEKVENALFEMR